MVLNSTHVITRLQVERMVGPLGDEAWRSIADEVQGRVDNYLDELLPLVLEDHGIEVTGRRVAVTTVGRYVDALAQAAAVLDAAGQEFPHRSALHDLLMLRQFQNLTADDELAVDEADAMRMLIRAHWGLDEDSVVDWDRLTDDTRALAERARMFLPARYEWSSDRPDAWDRRFFENRPDECDVWTANHWVAHFRFTAPLGVDIDEPDGFGLIRPILADVRDLVDAFTFGDSFEAWGDPPKGDDDHHLGLYFTAPNWAAADQRAAEIAGRLTRWVRVHPGAPTVSTAGDWAEQTWRVRRQVTADNDTGEDR